MNIDEWLREVQALLEASVHIDFGYPIRGNTVLAPEGSDAVRDSLRRAGLAEAAILSNFYSKCDGFSWPSIRNGYFVFRVKSLSRVDPENVPHTVVGPLACRIRVFGSSGGGDMFALTESLTVVHLPLGPMHDGVFDDRCGRTRQVASDFNGFLQLLLGDLRAFVEKDYKHRFLV
jgi:hypothetical protein